MQLIYLEKDKMTEINNDTVIKIETSSWKLAAHAVVRHKKRVDAPHDLLAGQLSWFVHSWLTI